MSLLDDVRAAERVVSTLTDGELQIYIDAAKRDMRRVGVREELIEPEETMDPMARLAVVMHVKGSYGHDDSEHDKWWKRYHETVTSMLNSSMNECDEASS